MVGPHDRASGMGATVKLGLTVSFRRSRQVSGHGRTRLSVCYSGQQNPSPAHAQTSLSVAPRVNTLPRQPAQLTWMAYYKKNASVVLLRVLCISVVHPPVWSVCRVHITHCFHLPCRTHDRPRQSPECQPTSPWPGDTRRRQEHPRDGHPARTRGSAGPRRGCR